MILGSDVPTFCIEPDMKRQVLKIGEEQNEVFSAYEDFRDDPSYENRWTVVDECCDVIMATLNLCARLGVDDLTKPMATCVRRNRERGRYAKEQ